MYLILTVDLKKKKIQEAVEHRRKPVSTEQQQTGADAKSHL